MNPWIDLEERLLSPDGMQARLLNGSNIRGNERIRKVEGEETPELIIEEVNLLSLLPSLLALSPPLWSHSRGASLPEILSTDSTSVAHLETQPLHHLPPPKPRLQWPQRRLLLPPLHPPHIPIPRLLLRSALHLPRQ
jgi:hypothetical protein